MLTMSRKVLLDFFLSNRVTPKKWSIAGSRFAAYKSFCVPTSRQALLDAIGASRGLLVARRVE
jgi:hypothetical protein